MCGVFNYVEVKIKLIPPFSLFLYLSTAPLPFSPPFNLLIYSLSACEYEQYFDIEVESETGMEEAESHMYLTPPSSLPHLITGECSDVSLNIPTKRKTLDDSGE